MQMPGADVAIVSKDKVVGYLLNPLHPDGAGKAQFFSAMGFRVDMWQTLARELTRLVQHSDVNWSVDSEHGQKYIIDGEIDTPSGRRPLVRTVWIVNQGVSIPRLVTAYPCEQELQS